jgi:hypothetical protein
MDDMSGARLERDLKLRIINIDCYDNCPAKGRRRHSAKSDTAAPKDRYNVCLCNAAPRDGVASNRERLDKAQLVKIQIRRIDRLNRNRDILRERAIALYSQGLVVSARVAPAVAAGGAGATTAVRREGDVHSCNE